MVSVAVCIIAGGGSGVLGVGGSSCFMFGVVLNMKNWIWGFSVDLISVCGFLRSIMFRKFVKPRLATS